MPKKGQQGNPSQQVSQPGQSIVEKDKIIGRLTTELQKEKGINARQAAELTKLKNTQTENKKALAEGAEAVQKLEDLKKKFKKHEDAAVETSYSSMNVGIEVGYWAGMRHSQKNNPKEFFQEFLNHMYDDAKDITKVSIKNLEEKTIEHLMKRCNESKEEWQHKKGEFQKLFESDTLQDQLQKAQDDNEKLQSEREGLRKSIQSYIDAKGKVQDLFDELKTETEQKIAQLEGQNETLKLRITGLLKSNNTEEIQNGQEYFARSPEEWEELTRENKELTDLIKEHITHIGELEKQIHKLEQNHLSMATEIAKLRGINHHFVVKCGVQEVFSELLLNVEENVKLAPDAAAASPDAEIPQTGTLDPSIHSEMEDIHNAMGEMASEMKVMQDQYNDEIKSIETQYTELLTKKQEESEAAQRALAKSMTTAGEFELKYKDCLNQNEQLVKDNESHEQLNLALNNRQKELNNQLETIADELHESREKLKTAKQQIVTAEQNGVEYTETIKALELALATKTELCEKLQSSITGGQNGGIVQAFAEYKENTQKQMDELQTELTKTKQHVLNKQQSVEQLKEDKQLLNGLLKQHEQSKKRLLEDLNELESQLQEAVTKNAQYSAELNDKIREIESLERSLKSSEERSTELEQECNALHEQCNKEIHELAVLEDSGHEMTDEERTEMKNALKQMMDTIKADLERKYGKDIHELQLKIDMLQRENTKLTKRLHGTQFLMSEGEDIRDNAEFKKLLHKYEALLREYEALSAENEGVFPGYDPAYEDYY